MSEINHPLKKYFDILELKPDATFLEVKNAYQHLKKLYSSQPLVLSPIIDEISTEKREDILTQLDEAYRVLKEEFASSENEKIKTAKQRVTSHNVPEFELFNGAALKLTREVLGIELKEIALYSGIPLSHLVNMEEENFDMLPPKGYIKIFLKKYSEYLSLDPKRVISDYFKHFDESKR